MRVYKKDSGVNCQILIRSRFANNEALKEIYRVLASGGVLGMIWNIEDCMIVSFSPNALMLTNSRQCSEIVGANHSMGVKDQSYYMVI